MRGLTSFFPVKQQWCKSITFIIIRFCQEFDSFKAPSWNDFKFRQQTKLIRKSYVKNMWRYVNFWSKQRWLGNQWTIFSIFALLYHIINEFIFFLAIYCLIGLASIMAPKHNKFIKHIKTCELMWILIKSFKKPNTIVHAPAKLSRFNCLFDVWFGCVLVSNKMKHLETGKWIMKSVQIWHSVRLNTSIKK